MVEPVDEMQQIHECNPFVLFEKIHRISLLPEDAEYRLVRVTALLCLLSVDHIRETIFLGFDSGVHDCDPYGDENVYTDLVNRAVEDPLSKIFLDFRRVREIASALLSQSCDLLEILRLNCGAAVSLPVNFVHERRDEDTDRIEGDMFECYRRLIFEESTISLDALHSYPEELEIFENAISNIVCSYYNTYAALWISHA